MDDTVITGHLDVTSDRTVGIDTATIEFVNPCVVDLEGDVTAISLIFTTYALHASTSHSAKLTAIQVGMRVVGHVIEVGAEHTTEVELRILTANGIDSAMAGPDFLVTMAARGKGLHIDLTAH